MPFMGKITTFGWLCFTLQVKLDFALFIVHLTSRGGRTSATVGLSAPLSNLVTAGHLLPSDIVIEVSVRPDCELPLTLTRLIGHFDQMHSNAKVMCLHDQTVRLCLIVLLSLSEKMISACVCVIVSVHADWTGNLQTIHLFISRY